eukprot:7868872-Alexandrium_andersonii.AAC.1
MPSPPCSSAPSSPNPLSGEALSELFEVCDYDHTGRINAQARSGLKVGMWSCEQFASIGGKRSC